MELRKICDDTRDMGIWELAHNQVFVKNKEAWYRNFEREISVRDLVREIYRKHVTTEDAEELADDEVFDDVMLEAGYYGTDNMEGVCSILYTALWGMADVREWLKAYETHGLPTTMQPEVLQNAVDTYGKEAQVDVAIEEMSELIKALLKNRRAEHSPEAWDYEKTRQNIFEEIADVVIMLTQLLMIFGGRDAVQKAIDAKVERLSTRLTGAAREAGADAAQDTLQSAT